MRREELRVSEHAVVRFQQRWCPKGTTRGFAREELERLVLEGSLRRTDGTAPGGGRVYVLDREIPIIVCDDAIRGRGWVVATILPVDAQARPTVRRRIGRNPGSGR